MTMLLHGRANLCRIDASMNTWRFYRMEIWPDLFGGAVLMRQWGRMQTEGRRRLDLHHDAAAAASALARIERSKRARGYTNRV